jgi:hypothetical protein
MKKLMPMLVDDFKEDDRWHPHRLIHDVEVNVLELLSYAYPLTGDAVGVRVQNIGEPDTARYITVAEGGKAADFRPLRVFCERDRTIWHPVVNPTGSIVCPTCANLYELRHARDKIWDANGHRLRLLPLPIIGMGVTFGYGSDRYPGTVTRVSDTGASFWFTRDGYKRTDKNGLSEMQQYEYTPDPEGVEHRASLSLTRGAYRRQGAYIALGYRQAYMDPHF